MKRVLSSLLCLMMLMLPAPAWAIDASVIANWWTRDEYCSEMAATIPDHENSDGSFDLLGELSKSDGFAPEDILILVEKPLGQTLINSVFHRSDYKDIQKLVEEVNQYYFSTVISARYAVFPETLCANTGIYKEVNARNLTALFESPDSGIGMTETDLGYKMVVCDISDDVAKVIIEREFYLSGYNPANETNGWCLEQGVREGYLLQKIDGEWKLENIIFQDAGSAQSQSNVNNHSVGHMNTFDLFEKTKDKDALQKIFEFNSCQRASYSSEGNYGDLIIGDIECPVFNYDKFKNR